MRKHYVIFELSAKLSLLFALLVVMTCCHAFVVFIEGDVFWCSLVDDVYSDIIKDFLEDENLLWDVFINLEGHDARFCLKELLRGDFRFILTNAFSFLTFLRTGACVLRFIIWNKSTYNWLES